MNSSLQRVQLSIVWSQGVAIKTQTGEPRHLPLNPSSSTLHVTLDKFIYLLVPQFLHLLTVDPMLSMSLGYCGD